MPHMNGRRLRLPLLMSLALSTAFGAAAEVKAPPLIEAVKNADEVAIRRLLQERVDVDARERDGTTALHWAAHRNDGETVDLLIRNGAKATATNRYGVTPLALAAENGNKAIIERLLAAGADPNGVLLGGETALMTTARTGDVAVVETLLAHGADVNAEDGARGQTALMWAAAAGNAEVILALVDAGANIGARAHRPPRPEDQGPRRRLVFKPGGQTLVEVSPENAATDEPVPVTATEAERTGAVPEPYSSKGLTPLLFAVREGHLGAVRALIDSGAPVTEATSAGMTALHVAITNAHWELAALLLDAGADPNAAGPGWTPLHEFLRTRSLTTRAPVSTGRLSSVELFSRLVAAGADVNARVTKNFGFRRADLEDSTPFLIAALGVDAQMMSLLAANGADPGAITPLETTALMWAAGADIFTTGPGNGAADDALEAVKVALELGNDVNDANLNGVTALIASGRRDAPEVTQLLIDQGAKLDAKTRTANRFGFDKRGELLSGPAGNGCTALMNAVSTWNCRPATTREPMPRVEAVLRKALQEQGLPAELPAAEGRLNDDRQQ